MLPYALEYARSRKEQNLSRLCDWLRIPSVSTLPEHVEDVRRAAEWAAAYLREIGFERVEIYPTERHPILYAERLGGQSSTLLVYGHFDVQPVDPLEEWRTHPFEPTVVGDNIYSRGADDDKGQVFAVLAALEAYLRTNGRLPCDVKLLLEGEEEVMSPSLPVYLREHSQDLQADAILICDQEMLAPQVPLILYGVRGNLYLEVEVSGPARDLHSGTFGGAVDNPFNVLARLLASLQDGESRKVLVPGFYDRVQPLSEDEQALIARAPIIDEAGLYLTGAPALAGEAGYSLAERVSVRPTLDIHGIAGGFIGAGGKTVIPARATARLSTRLVPNQQPEEIARLIERYLRGLAPKTVRIDVRVIGMAKPVVIDFRARPVQIAAQAYENGFGYPPIYLRGGGSLPILSDLIDALSPEQGEKIPVVMMGFGLPDDNTHAPNEKLFLPNFYQGIETIIHYIDLFAGLN